MNAQQVLNALSEYYGTNGREWAFFEELRIGTGYSLTSIGIEQEKKGINVEQRLDAWAINLYPSKKYLRRCHEIKVSRSDFLHEIKNPQKRQQGLDLSNEFYFVVPKGMVEISEIPEETGLMYIGDFNKCKIIKRAPYREIEEPPIYLFASIARRAAVFQNQYKILNNKA